MLRRRFWTGGPLLNRATREPQSTSNPVRHPHLTEAKHFLEMTKTAKQRCPPYKKGRASLTDRRTVLLHVSRRRTPNSSRSIRSRHEYPVVVHRHSRLSKIHSRRSRHIRLQRRSRIQLVAEKVRQVRPREHRVITASHREGQGSSRGIRAPVDLNPIPHQRSRQPRDSSRRHVDHRTKRHRDRRARSRLCSRRENGNRCRPDIGAARRPDICRRGVSVGAVRMVHRGRIVEDQPVRPRYLGNHRRIPPVADS
jgi:hypothetical protein